MQVPDKLNSSEFQDLVRKGVIGTDGKRLKTNSLSPDYEKLLSDFENEPKTDNLFKEDAEYKKAEIMEPKSYNEVLDKLRERQKEGKIIYITGNCPSSKNSKEIIQQPTKLSMCHKMPLYKVGEVWHCSECHQKADRKFIPRLVMSKLCQKYIDTTRPQWDHNREKFLKLIEGQKKPIYLGVYAIRESAHRFDFINMCQIFLDIMAYHKEGEQDNRWIADDNTNEIIPVFLGTHKDPSKAGLILTILDHETYYKSLINIL